MAEGIDIVLERIQTDLGGRSVLRDLWLRAPQGQVTAVLGPSGCGKTTLLRVIAGLVPTHGGRVLLGNHDATSTAPWQRQIGMVFQDLALYPHMTVEANLAFSLRGRGISSADRSEKIRWVSELFEFDSWLDRYPKELSGGEQQRVALGRAVVSEPRVLLLDEPFSHLDAPLRLRLRESLLEWQRHREVTCMVVTHDAVDAMAMADHMVVMSEGCVVQAGFPEDVYHQPENRLVAQFTGTMPMNWLPGTLRGDQIEFEGIGVVMCLGGVGDLGGVGGIAREYRVDAAIRSVDWVWTSIEDDGPDTSEADRKTLAGVCGIVRRCHPWEDRWLITAEILLSGQTTQQKMVGIYCGKRPEIDSRVRGSIRGLNEPLGEGPECESRVENREQWSPFWVFSAESGQRVWPGSGDSNLPV